MKIVQDKKPIPPIRKRFANNLRIIRRLKDLSQEELAFNAGISRAYLGDVERGKRAVTIDIMGQLAEALEVDLTLLLQKDVINSILVDDNVADTTNK